MYNVHCHLLCTCTKFYMGYHLWKKKCVHSALGVPHLCRWLCLGTMIILRFESLLMLLNSLLRSLIVFFAQTGPHSFTCTSFKINYSHISNATYKIHKGPVYGRGVKVISLYNDGLHTLIWYASAFVSPLKWTLTRTGSLIFLMLFWHGLLWCLLFIQVFIHHPS